MNRLEAACQKRQRRNQKRVRQAEPMPESKRRLIDAICGRGFRSTEEAIHYERAGLARFCGDQWNEDWCWIPAKLQTLKGELLQSIYQNDKA